MSRPAPFDKRALDALLHKQANLLTRSQALAIMSDAALRHRVRAGGPWHVILPGIYLARGDALGTVQREVAAALYAGRGCVITGASAAMRYGVRLPAPDVVDVLIPAVLRRQSAGFVRVHRTERMPDKPWQIDGLLWAPAVRAVADAARYTTGVREVRALVADAVQRGRCTVSALIAELQAGPTQGSAALRVALEEVAEGVRSVAEGDLRKLIIKAGLPEPMYNPSLYVGSQFLARPDAYWPHAGVACEIDSREWHLSPAQQEHDMIRHARMEAQGVHVLHFPPRRLRTKPAEVASLLGSALEAGSRRPELPIRAVPCDVRPVA